MDGNTIRIDGVLYEAVSGDGSLVDRIVEYIDGLGDRDYIRVANAYDPDHPTLTPDEFNEYFRGWKALDIIRAAVTMDGEEFDPYARYFSDLGEDGWVCIDRASELRHPQYTRDMAEFAVEEDNDFGDSVIRGILDGR